MRLDKHLSLKIQDTNKESDENGLRMDSFIQAIWLVSLAVESLMF